MDGKALGHLNVREVKGFSIVVDRLSRSDRRP